MRTSGTSNKKGGTHELEDLESQQENNIPNQPQGSASSNEAQHEAQELAGPTITDGTFTLIDKILYFSTKKDNNLRLCIPKSMIKETLHQNHNLRGHPGIRRTYLTIQPRYYFPQMSCQVKIHCNECAVCQTSKPSNEHPLGQAHLISTDEPLHTLSVDFITGLPLSDGKDALFTFTDKFTKAIQLVPCNKTTSAEDAARLYLHHCYSTFGLPTKFISDRDARFTSRFWRTLMRLLNIQEGMTSVFHSNTDGQAEKTNQTVEIGLRCFLRGEINEYSNWTEYLPILEHEYNSMKHESTGYTPNELRYIVPPHGISDLAVPPRLSSESAESLAEQLKNARNDARDSLVIAQKKQKKYSDKLTPKVFQVGDLVCLKYNRFGPSYKPPADHKHKLAPISTPVRILERLSPVSYRLDLPEGSRIHDVVSVLHLREFKGSGEDIRPLPVIVDDTEEWEVESIGGERVTPQGVTQYLVRWKGYGPDDRTWQTLEDLANAKASVLAWKASRNETVVPRRPVVRRSPRKSARRSKRSG